MPTVVRHHFDVPASGADASSDDLPVGTAVESWTIDAVIGRGGMSTVYAATHRVIGKRAAIKVIRPEVVPHETAVARLVREAQVSNLIAHPAIIDVFHVGVLGDGRPFLVMELLKGRSLADAIDERRMDPIEGLDVLLAVCSCLKAAHAADIIHRDLKPENIFLVEVPGSEAAAVKLLDWGIAKPLAAASLRVTTTGMIVGTPLYASPEQARGQAVTAQSDLYSLGVVAFEVLLEGTPFVADSPVDLVAKHLLEAPPRPAELWPDIPGPLDELLTRLLAKDAADRPTLDEASAVFEEVRAQLEGRVARTGGRRLARGTPAPAGRARRSAEAHARTVPGLALALPPAVTRRDATTMPIRRGRSRVVIIAALVSSILVAGGWWLVQPSRPTGAARATSEALVPGEPSVDASGLEPPVAASGAMAPATAPDAGASLGPTPIRLRIRPASARVALDGSPLAGVAGVWETSLPPGSHALTVDAPGFRSHRSTVLVEAGQPVELEVRLTPQPPPRPTSGRTRPHRPPSAPAGAPVDPDATIDAFEP